MRFPGSLRLSASLALALALMGGAPGRCQAQQRDLYNTVNVAAAAFIYPDSFRSYVDSTGARGFRSMRVAGAWRLKCWQCAPDTIDIDTNPPDAPLYLPIARSSCARAM